MGAKMSNSIAKASPVVAPVAPAIVSPPARISYKAAGTGKIELLVSANPKKPGSLAFNRFALYVSGMSVTAYVAACKAREGVTDKPRNATADIAYDTAKGYIRIV